MIPRSFAKRGWTLWHLPAALAFAAVGVALTREAWTDIYRIALSDEESSHIFLVPVVAAWMVWARRIRFTTCRPTGTLVGTALVAAGVVLMWMGTHFARQAFWHSGAVVIVVGCLLTVLGEGVLVRFLPAFVVLAFLVPIPGHIRLAIAQPVQTATAATAQTLLEAFGIPVERTVNVVTINQIEVAVVEACNGLRMIFALLLVSYAFAFGLPLRGYARVLVIAISPAAAILCNVIRLVPTVLLYGYAPRPWAEWFHSVSAWLMLPIAFLLLLGVVSSLRWALIPVTRYNLAYQ